MASVSPIFTRTVLPVSQPIGLKIVDDASKLGYGLFPGPMAWVGSQFVDESTFVFHLTVDDIGEIDAAMNHFLGPSEDRMMSSREGSEQLPGLLSPETFPLPTLGPKLRALSRRVHQGEGFFVLRGLEPSKYKRLENTVIFAGISSYVGNKRALQSVDGPTMTHIFDYSTEVEEKERINEGYLGHANRTSYLPFHTDDGDILALYCLNSATQGGRTLLASAWAIYNRLVIERPDVIATLSEEWTWDSFIEKDPSFQRPLLIEHKGNLICNYRIRPFLGTPGYPRNAALGPLPVHQEEALNVVARMADEMSLPFDFGTGDLQFVNNFSLLHAREEFFPSKEDFGRRHLLRLVLRDDELGWDVPEALQKPLEKLFNHEAKDEKFLWSPEPLPYVIGQ